MDCSQSPRAGNSGGLTKRSNEAIVVANLRDTAHLLGEICQLLAIRNFQYKGFFAEDMDSAL
jgi:hypothetical protein